MSFLWRWVWGSKKSKKSVATNDVKKEEQTPKEDEMVKEDVDSLFSHVDDSFDKYLVPLDSFKVVIVGDAGVGKTSYLNLLVNNGNTTGFKPTYSPTYGVNVVPVKFSTNKGMILVDFWDCAGQEKYNGLGDTYYIGAHAFLVVCSMNSVLSFKNIPSWLKSIQQSGERNDVVAVVATNLDCAGGNASVLPSKLYKLPVFEVSNKNVYPSNRLPIQHVLQQLTNNPSLYLL